jgi:hypothetical protein
VPDTTRKNIVYVKEVLRGVWRIPVIVLQQTKRITMYKHFFLYCLSMLMAAPSFTQVHLEIQSGVSLGTRAFTPDTEEVVFVDVESGPITQFTAALGAKKYLTEQFGIGLEAQFAQRGFSQTATGTPVASGFRASYLDLIPQVEFRPWPFLGLVAGGLLGFRVEEAYRTAEDNWESYTNLANLGVRTRGEDAAILLGLRGYWKQFFFSANYLHGLIAVESFTVTDANGEDIGQVEGRHRGVRLCIGYQLPIGQSQN